MKNIRLTIFAAFILGGYSALNAQTLYDANRFMGSDLNGTARFVGMGGAMGALGGDISTMGTNPAGIGIYRSNDAMISFGFNKTNAKATLDKSVMETDKYHGSFDNAGLVISNKISNYGALRFVNFGFNYHKVKSFDKNMAMGGNMSYDYNGQVTPISQTDQFVALSQGLYSDLLNSDAAFTNVNVPWLGAMALRTHLIGTAGGDNTYESNVGFTHDGEGNVVYSPVFGNYSSKEKGGLYGYDFNVAFNLYDRIYIGATLGAYSVDYSRYSIYQENYNGDVSNYSLENWYDTSGAGVDFKLGIIARPFETLPLRLGLAVHTPTWYSLEDRTSAIITSDVDMNSSGVIESDERFQYDTMDNPGESRTKYQLITPWKYNFSLGYTIGHSVALGAEYEYSDYSTAKLKYDDGTTMGPETNGIKTGLKGVNTWRFGAEFKIIPEFAFRLGYNHITSSMYSDDFKELPLNSIRTDTEFSNVKAANNYTLGIGYRGQCFYADLAYQYNTYKEDFYPFYNNIYDPGTKTSSIVVPNATKVTNNKSQVLLTLGMRF